MNAVEIEEAISALSEQAFDPVEFPYAFLRAFGNKETTIKRLRSGDTNKSDLGGVLQRDKIHICVCSSGEVTKTLAALKSSPATARAKARFILATDGADFEAEELETGETVACAYRDFPDHFGFFLLLAGITTVKQVRESSFDIRATSRMNRLYVELLKDNPGWGTAARRHDMNHFMARLIFCFFAERTDIFQGIGLFTGTIERMSAKDSSNTHEVIGELFRAMNTKQEGRASAGIPRWADAFPYVNGELFSGSVDAPHFSKIARSYLLHIGNLDWTKINPDIFGSMIQAVAEDEERGALGMHYTSVPNILKVLNPLFLDSLREQLEEAGNNARMLLNLRKRMAKIRVFDPACGSGKGLAEPKSKEATRICQEDLNEVIAAFVQDKTAIERGLFDEELVPEELTQVRMGKIIKDRYPELDEEDQEAVRQHAITALNLTQQAKQIALGGGSDGEESANTALIDGVRKFAMDVRELDIDLIDRINPFGEAYAILAKTMSEESLKQVAAAIAAKRTSLTPEEAKELAVRAVKFKKERGRLPLISSTDAWEKRMAEGAAAFVRFKDEGRYE